MGLPSMLGHVCQQANFCPGNTLIHNVTIQYIETIMPMMKRTSASHSAF